MPVITFIVIRSADDVISNDKCDDVITAIVTAMQRGRRHDGQQ